MLRHVRSKTGQEADGGWRPVQEAGLRGACGGKDRRGMGWHFSSRYGRITRMPLACFTLHSDYGVPFYSFGYMARQVKGMGEVTVGKSTPAHDSGVSLETFQGP